MSYKIRIQGWTDQGTGLWSYFDSGQVSKNFPGVNSSALCTDFKTLAGAVAVADELRKVFVNVQVVEIIPASIKVVGHGE